MCYVYVVENTNCTYTYLLFRATLNSVDLLFIYLFYFLCECVVFLFVSLSSSERNETKRQKKYRNKFWREKKLLRSKFSRLDSFLSDISLFMFVSFLLVDSVDLILNTFCHYFRSLFFIIHVSLSFFVYTVENYRQLKKEINVPNICVQCIQSAQKLILCSITSTISLLSI